MEGGRLDYIFIASLDDPNTSSIVILFTIQWSEAKFGEFSKHFFNFVSEVYWGTVLIDKSNIKIPLGKIVPMIDNVSYVVEVNFSDLFAIGIYDTFVFFLELFCLWLLGPGCLASPIL